MPALQLHYDYEDGVMRAAEAALWEHECRALYADRCAADLAGALARRAACARCADMDAFPDPGAGGFDPRPIPGFHRWCDDCQMDYLPY